MKPIADWIRARTPGWSDEDRYTLVSRIHSWGPPVCLILFVFTDNVVIRFFTLVLVLVTLVSEFVLRDCLVTMVEREFSDSTWDDVFQWGFRESGWDLTRPEKMALNIGLNSGFLLLLVLMLLRESVLWVVGFTGLAVSALPALGLLSTGFPPLETVGLLPSQILLPPVSP
jgi:hypothetical protein